MFELNIEHRYPEKASSWIFEILTINVTLNQHRYLRLPVNKTGEFE